MMPLLKGVAELGVMEEQGSNAYVGERGGIGDVMGGGEG